MEEEHKKESAELAKESGKLDEAMTVKQAELAVVLQEIKREIAKATTAHERGLRIILLKYQSLNTQVQSHIRRRDLHEQYQAATGAANPEKELHRHFEHP